MRGKKKALPPSEKSNQTPEVDNLFFLPTVNLKSEGHNQCSSAVRFTLSARVLFISLWSWKDYNENAQRKKGGTIVNSFLWQLVSAFSHSLAFIQTNMTNVLQWIDEIFLSGYGIKIKQYCTDFSLWVLSSSYNCWTLAELLTPLIGNKSKTWERFCSPGLVNVWDLQLSLITLSDSSGFNILPATMGAFFSSWKRTFPWRSHIYSFLKRSLLVMGLL